MGSGKRAANSEETKEEKPWALEVRELEPEEEKLMKELERSTFDCLAVVWDAS